MHQLELLAPAQNLEFGINAITHGADAVYIGARAFGAREAASNSTQDIEKLVKFAHLYNAKVYAAVNTVLYEAELEDAKVLINELYNCGVDALIIQDLGLLQLDLPPIALHASTQMDNREIKKLNFLHDIGFSRAVLARELSIDEIKNISKHCQIELEAFIHGSLCVSYSGLCNISQSITKRSANRGNCAQMCRLECSLKDRQGNYIAKDKHLLSLKDLNQTDNLDTLIYAGIRSFKIEGRLKNLSYLKNVTAWYRQHLDEFIVRNPDFRASSNGTSEFNFTPNLEKTFNRGYTDYFSTDRTNSITEFRTPKFYGEPIGVVTSISFNSCGIDTKEVINNGDGLCFFSNKDKLIGLRVNKVEGNKLFFQKSPQFLVGTKLYRNLDLNFINMLEKESARRYLDVSFVLSAKKEHFCLQAICAGIEITNELALTPTLAKVDSILNIKSQLKKTKDTIFKVIDVLVDDNWFIPVSLLNKLKRETLELLTQKILASYLPNKRKTAIDTEYVSETLNYLANVTNSKASEFYTKHGVKNVDFGFDIKPIPNAKLMLTKHCLRYSFNLCPKQNKDIKATPLLLELGGKEFKLTFACNVCEMHIST